jgi:uroporphyrinogen III methyltransferase/synthase
MNTTGKTAASMAALAFLLGVGWWALDRDGPNDALPSAPQSASAEAVPGSTAPLTAALDAQWVAELQASVQLLAETLATTGNVGGAIALIDLIDARIGRQPAAAKLAPVRAALASDRQKLVAAKSVDIVAAAAVIDGLIADVDAMPLIASPQPSLAKAGAPVTHTESAPALSLDRIMQAIRERFADVVRIRKVEHPEAVFLTPEQGALIAERLRLRLLSARLALVSRQQAMFAQDMAMAEAILAKTYDPQDDRVIKAKASVAELKAMANRLAVPIALQSLSAIAQLQSELSARP